MNWQQRVARPIVGVLVLGSFAIGGTLAAPQEAPDSSQMPIAGRHCYALDDEVFTIHVRFDLDDDGAVSGRTHATVHDEGSGYFTSYTQEFAGAALDGRASVDVTTHIEYDVQNSSETWLVGAEQLRTGLLVLERVDCASIAHSFEDAAGEDLLDYEDPIHTRRLELTAGSEQPLTVENGVVRGERDLYLIAAEAGQRLTVKITSLERNAVFALVSPAGSFLATGSTVEQIVLPASGDYELSVGGTRGNASYTLTLKLE